MWQSTVNNLRKQDRTPQNSNRTARVKAKTQTTAVAARSSCRTKEYECASNPSKQRSEALKEAAEKAEAESTPQEKLGESNASIKNLTEQNVAKLLENGELNAAENAKLERIFEEKN